MEPLILGAHAFTSRLLTGTGRMPSLAHDRGAVCLRV